MMFCPNQRLEWTILELPTEADIISFLSWNTNRKFISRVRVNQPLKTLLTEKMEDKRKLLRTPVKYFTQHQFELWENIIYHVCMYLYHA